MKNQNTPIGILINGPFNDQPKLNEIAAHFRTTDFCSKFVSQEGFDINFMSKNWEWNIRFNGKEGWMCLYQDDTTSNVYHLYAYEYEDQILMNPTLSFRVDSISRAKQVIPQVVKKLYHEKIQNYGR